MEAISGWKLYAITDECGDEDVTMVARSEEEASQKYTGDCGDVPDEVREISEEELDKELISVENDSGDGTVIISFRQQLEKQVADPDAYEMPGEFSNKYAN